MLKLATDVDFDLNNGKKIPALGLGTVPPPDASQIKDQVITAVKAGYHHIDTAWFYGSEKYIGEALQQLFKEGYKREDLFITTKVWPLHWKHVERGLDESLALLQLDYVDLLLQHWPVAFDTDDNDKPAVPKDDNGRTKLADDPVTGTKYLDVYGQLEQILQTTSKVKLIGVSNYSIPRLRALLKVAKVVPVVNQVEYHPQLPQQDLTDFAKQHGIVLFAYSPLGSTGAPVLQLKEVQDLATKYNVSGAEVANAYNILQGRGLISRLSNLDRIKTNIRLPPLTDDELKTLYKVGEENPKRYINPDFGQGLGFRWWKGDTLSKEFD